MRKLLFSLLAYCFLIFQLSAQTIKGQVISAEDGSPLSYAKVGFGKTKKGIVTDEKGHFTLEVSELDKNDVIIVEYPVHDSFYQNVGEFLSNKDYIIELNEKTFVLDDIVIEKKKLVDRNWGIKSKSKGILMGFHVHEKEEDYGTEIGILIRNKKRAKIERINLNVAQFKTEEPMLVRFNIYSRKDGFPDEIIVNEDLKVEITEDDIKNGTYTLDVSDKGIWIDREDFFVTMQILRAKGSMIYISGALARTTYERDYYDDWEKFGIAGPAINVDVKVEK